MKRNQTLIITFGIIAAFGYYLYFQKTKSQVTELSSRSSDSSAVKTDRSIGNSNSNSNSNSISNNLNTTNVDSAKEGQNNVNSDSLLVGPSFDALDTAIKNQTSNEFWDMSGFQESKGQWVISGQGLKLNPSNEKSQIFKLASFISSQINLMQKPMETIGEPIETDELKTYSVRFDYEGVEVRNAILKVVVDKLSQEVSIIQLDNIPLQSVKNSIRLSTNEVESIMQKQIPNKIGPVAIQSNPVIDVNSRGEGRNAWIAIVETSKPKDKKQYFIDAENGKIIHSNSIIIRD